MVLDWRMQRKRYLPQKWKPLFRLVATIEKRAQIPPQKWREAAPFASHAAFLGALLYV